MKRARVFIYGDVVGVGFRAWTARLAQDKQLTGWVRNVGKDCVEAVFEGDEKKIKEMIERCKKGPEVSWVEKVEVKWSESSGEFSNFEIKY